MGTDFWQYKDGRYVEGVGFSPKVRVPPGKDALDAAKEWLTEDSNFNSQVGEEFRDIVAIRDDYLAHASEAGLKLGFLPGLIELTRPSFISWRAELKAIAVPSWKELSQKQRAFMALIAGPSESKQKELFSLLFRWFLIPHELTHALQDAQPRELTHSASEREANDVAAAYFYSREKERPKLRKLEKLLQRAYTRLPKEARASLSEERFNQEYQQLSQRPEEYAAYQLTFILNSLRNAPSRDLKKLLLRIADEAEARPMKCALFCDVNDIETVHEWQFEQSNLRPTPPNTETLVNCFSPTFVCTGSQCSKGAKTEVRWQENSSTQPPGLLHASCTESKKFGALLVARFPGVSLLVGSGKIELKTGALSKTFFYKGAAGE